MHQLSNEIMGKVESVDESGRLVSDISNDQVADIPHNESLTVKFGGHATIGLYSPDHEHPTGTMFASLGNSGFVEIEIVGINLSEMLGIKVGESVSLKW